MGEMPQERCLKINLLAPRRTPKPLDLRKMVPLDSGLMRSTKYGEVELANDAKEMLRRDQRYQALAAKLRLFQECGEDIEFGARVLRRYVKKDSRINDEEIAKYKIVLDTPGPPANCGDGLRFPERFHHAKYILGLVKDSDLIATLGFQPSEGAITVIQIQGISGKKDELNLIKWERVMLTSLFDWAKSHGIPQVKVLAAENNPLVIYNEGGLEHAKFLYNITAHRCGFRLDEDGNYIRKTIDSI